LYPLLLNFGGLSIQTYSLFLAAALVIGLIMTEREARRRGQSIERIRDMCFYAIIAAMIGSRLSFVLFNPVLFEGDLLEIFRIWDKGLEFYGGFLGACIAVVLYARMAGMPLGETADILVPSLAAGQFLARIGCFFAGCCHGKICEYPWSVVFTNSESLAPVGIPLHPTQLYYASGNLFTLLVLLILRRFKGWSGLVFWSYLFLYGLLRMAIDGFRGDVIPTVGWGEILVTQVIGMVMAVTALCVIGVKGIRAARSARRKAGAVNPNIPSGFKF
jgi:phosphatidylglycerol:prolipoprotein diacylglycerol transferase